MDTMLLFCNRTPLTDDHLPWLRSGIMPHPDDRDKTIIHEMAPKCPITNCSGCGYTVNILNSPQVVDFTRE